MDLKIDQNIELKGRSNVCAKFRPKKVFLVFLVWNLAETFSSRIAGENCLQI